MPPTPQDPEENKEETKKEEINLDNILLPKKEVASPASAQRINAGVLLEQETTATLKDESVTPTPTPVPPKKVEKSVVQPLQTYRGDIEGLVQDKNVSVVNIAAAEASRRDTQAQTTQAEPTVKKSSGVSKILMVGVGLLLLVGAGSALAYVFLRPTPSVQIAQNPQAPFLLVDATQIVPLAAGSLSRQSVMTNLQNARTNIALSLGLMARLYPSAVVATPDSMPTLVSIQTILSTLSSTIPAELVRAINPYYYTLGVHAFDENQAFLLIRVDSYAQAYSGMLAWEHTMYNDLVPLFVRTPRPRINNEEVATSTPPVQVLGTTFSDRVVENRDSRVVQNEAGDILLLWTFLDRSTIAITTNEHTLREIITRFTDISIVPQF